MLDGIKQKPNCDDVLVLNARSDDLYVGYKAVAEGPDDRGLEDEDDEIVEGIVLEEESSSEWLYAIKSVDLTGFSIILSFLWSLFSKITT